MHRNPPLPPAPLPLPGGAPAGAPPPWPTPTRLARAAPAARAPSTWPQPSTTSSCRCGGWETMRGGARHLAGGAVSEMATQGCMAWHGRLTRGSGASRRRPGRRRPWFQESLWSLTRPLPHLQPTGLVSVTGLAAQGIYARGFLERWGVKPAFFAREVGWAGWGAAVQRCLVVRPFHEHTWHMRRSCAAYMHLHACSQASLSAAPLDPTNPGRSTRPRRPSSSTGRPAARSGRRCAPPWPACRPRWCAASPRGAASPRSRRGRAGRERQCATAGGAGLLLGMAACAGWGRDQRDLREAVMPAPSPLALLASPCTGARRHRRRAAPG